MKFQPLSLDGAYTIELEPLADERGTFARTFCRHEFEARGLDAHIAQCSISYNRRRGTLRGMHYQVAPFEETKLVRCARGAIYDVIVDLRAGSATRMQWAAAELSADNRRMLYVPAGFAHGFQTLTDDSEVFYQISEWYSPEHARGVRWNDDAFAIRWALTDPIISDKDRSYPDWSLQMAAQSAPTQ
jgi:dTDP-4-dehydrorhamnose 3,5-epimerase